MLMSRLDLQAERQKPLAALIWYGTSTLSRKLATLRPCVALSVSHGISGATGAADPSLFS